MHACKLFQMSTSKDFLCVLESRFTNQGVFMIAQLIKLTKRQKQGPNSKFTRQMISSDVLFRDILGARLIYF